MRQLFGCTRGYAVYIDESGSFELRLGRTDAIAAAVVPRRAISRVVKFVRDVEASAVEGERVEGEVKGSHLRPERYERIIAFARRWGIRFSPFAGEQAVQSRKEKGLPEAAAKLRDLVDGTPRQPDGEAVAAAFERLGPEDRYYCTFAYRLIKEGYVCDLVRAGRWPIDVIYDPKLSPKYDAALRFAVNSAFVELDVANVPSPLDALLGDPDTPWTVRPAGPADREGIALVDWLVYPLAVALRDGVSAERKATYGAICSAYDNARISVHPISGPDDVLVGGQP